ncbi:MAG TPA: hypothetical protein VGF82_12170, partial [Terracidiphilus sp.]
MASFANALISSAIAANYSLVPKFIFCGVEQGYGAFPEGLQKQCKLLWTALAMLELLLFGWIVDEPIAQLC